VTAHSWIRHLFARSLRTTRKSAPRFRPLVEALEAREVPTASYTAANAADLIKMINTTNSTGGTNTIVLTGAVTSALDSSNPYNLTMPDNTTHGPNGLPVIAAGNNLTIQGTGQAISRKYVPSNQTSSVPTFRLFDVASGASLSLDDVTLFGGAADGVADGAQGGAIYSAGTLSLNNVTVENSYAAGEYQTPQPTQPITTLPPGGGGENTSPPNTTPVTTDAQGGAIYIATGTANITNSTLHLNKAFGELSGAGPRSVDGSNGLGGGLYVAGGQVNIIGSTFDLNMVEGGMGGLVPGGVGGAGGNGYGGALCVAGGSVELVNSTLGGNSATGGTGGEGTYVTVNPTTGEVALIEPGYAGGGGDGFAGGVYISGGSLTVGFSTIAGNTAYFGRGAPAESESDGSLQGTSNRPSVLSDAGSNGTANGGGVVVGGGTFISTNSIFATNGQQSGVPLNPGETVPTSPSDIVDSLAFTGASGSVSASDDNLIGAYSGSFDTSHDILNPSFVGLGSLANNGGPTKTMALLPGSPAIDAGDDVWVGTLATDQRGTGFARVVGAHVDIGAYEAQNLSQTISFGPLANQTYGATVTLSATALSNLPVSFAVKSGPATLSGNVLTVTGVGTIVVEATQAGNGAYSAAAPVDQSFVASPATLHITASSESKVYGTSDPPLFFAAPASDFQNGDTANMLTGQLGRAAGEAVGSYAINQGTLSAGSNYSIIFAGGTLNITPALLTVTANANSKTYGQTASDTGTLSGVVSGDGITATFASAGDASTAAVGSYTISATLSDPNNKLSNYTIQQASATLTVNKAALFIVADGNYKTYGQTASDTGTLSGVVSGDGITATFASAGDASTAAVGNYIVIAKLSDPNNKLTNYTIQEVAGTLTVDKAALFIVADGNYKTYGQTASDTGTLSGVVSGDGITATFASAGDASTAAVGNYIVIATLSDPNNKLTNYTIQEFAGTLTVNPAALTVTADSLTKITGEANPTFTVSYSGFVLGQGAGVLGGTLSFSTPATTSSPPGSYTITPSGLTSSNYSITFVQGTLTVLSYSQATTNLLAQVPAGLAQGIQSSLDNQLQAAIACFRAGETADGVSQLAAFIHHVSAQSGQHIDAGTAASLIASAQEIINAVG
jgi:hypothetical protein